MWMTFLFRFVKIRGLGQNKALKWHFHFFIQNFDKGYLIRYILRAGGKPLSLPYHPYPPWAHVGMTGAHDDDDDEDDGAR